MKAKILIVDDEPHIRFLLEQTLAELEDEGVELLLAGDGSSAWESVQKEKPDLVFLDTMMPGLSGHEVCKRIKLDPVTAHAYVTMLTARGKCSDRTSGEEAGANRYLTKPFDPEYILKLSRDVLEDIEKI
jgi:DNA-binding response OmpR family regulator